MTFRRDEPTCSQCGAAVAPNLRYCVHCYAPVGAVASGAHLKLAHQINTTHRVDPTLIFCPEKQAEMVRRGRRRKRVIIAAIALVTTAVAVSVSLNLLASRRQKMARAFAREQAAWRDLNALANALERFKGDVSRYPTNEEGLLCLARRPAAFPPDNADHAIYWFGPYLENVPEVDPWGNDYIYATADGGRSFELFSYGPQGETGSDGRFRVASKPPAAGR